MHKNLQLKLSDTSLQIKKNLLDSLNHDCSFTIENFANMQRRFSTRNSYTSFVLVYYSLISIINDLLPKFFVVSDKNLNVLEFFNVCASIVFFYFALQIGFANYGSRSNKLSDIVAQLKFFTKQLKKYSETGISREQYKKLVNEYHELIETAEAVPRRDYYHTCQTLDSKRIYTYFTRYERIMIRIQIVSELLLYIIVALVPVLLYLYIFLVK